MISLFKKTRVFLLSGCIRSIRFYQRCIALRFGSMCRFYPSCSHYFIAALDKHGMWYGGIKGILRILRCNPFFLGGYDPVENCNHKIIEVEKCRKELF